MIEMNNFTVRIDFFERADGDSGFGSFKCCKHRFEHCGFDSVVGIDESKIFSSGFLDAGIAGSREPLIFLIEEFDAGVFFDVVLSDFGGIVGRAVIDKNNFDILVGLSEDGI